MFMKLKTQMDQQDRRAPKRKPNNRMVGKPNSQLKTQTKKTTTTTSSEEKTLPTIE
jgi:hypothetical protein